LPEFKPEVNDEAVFNYLSYQYNPLEETFLKGVYKLPPAHYIEIESDGSFKIKKYLREGKIVISNRYVTANMGHQGGKIANPQERKKYFKWLYDLEYGIFGIPQPDLNMILHVDAAIAQKLVDGKDARSYIKGQKKRDLHEKDLKHLRDAEKVYLEIAKNFPNSCLIKCTENKNIMTREKISELVWKEIKKVLK